MTCNHEVQQGFTACGMKLDVSDVNTAHFASPERHLFNVYLTSKYDTNSGIVEKTNQMNNKPLTFEEAAKRVRGLLTSLGVGILGFQRVVDCWIEPIDLKGVVFRSEKERDRWLLAFIEQDRQRDKLEAEAGIDPKLLLELAELRGKVARIHGGVL